MVLNNRSPYSSDNDDDLDPWEFIEDDNLATLGGEARGDETANQGDVASRTPNVDDEPCNVSRKKSIKADPGDLNLEDNLEEGAASPSLGIHKEASENRDENSNSSVCDSTKENPVPSDTSNDENADPWTPLNAEETASGRPDSPDQTLPLPLHETWNFITSSLREIDNQNRIRQRTRNSVKKLNTSAQNLWTNLTSETQRLAITLQNRCDQADVQAREASQNIQRTVSSTKDNICRLNSEYRIHEKVAAVAAVGGAILVAAGNPRAAAGSLLVAGGALAAGEAMGASSERGCSTFTRDFGLREGVHLD